MEYLDKALHLMDDITIDGTYWMITKQTMDLILLRFQSEVKRIMMEETPIGIFYQWWVSTPTPGNRSGDDGDYLSGNIILITTQRLYTFTNGTPQLSFFSGSNRGTMGAFDCSTLVTYSLVPMNVVSLHVSRTMLDAFLSTINGFHGKDYAHYDYKALDNAGQRNVRALVAMVQTSCASIDERQRLSQFEAQQIELSARHAQQQAELFSHQAQEKARLASQYSGPTDRQVEASAQFTAKAQHMAALIQQAIDESKGMKKRRSLKK